MNKTICDKDMKEFAEEIWNSFEEDEESYEEALKESTTPEFIRFVFEQGIKGTERKWHKKIDERIAVLEAENENCTVGEIRNNDMRIDELEKLKG